MHTHVFLRIIFSLFLFFSFLFFCTGLSRSLYVDNPFFIAGQLLSRLKIFLRLIVWGGKIISRLPRKSPVPLFVKQSADRIVSFFTYCLTPEKTKKPSHQQALHLLGEGFPHLFNLVIFFVNCIKINCEGVIELVDC